MSQALPSATAFRVSKLSQNSETPFQLRPTPAALKALAADLDLLDLRKLAFTGHIKGEGRSDWRLTAKLGATLVQPCAVTLEPVTTRIDIDVVRVFLARIDSTEEEEIEMPEDETIESLGTYIDPNIVMIESLILEIPAFPRLEGASLKETVFTEPGLAPMTDEDARPFAALASLIKSSDKE